MLTLSLYLAFFVPKLQSSLMKIDHRVARGETYRLLTALFAHSGVSHLIMNCFSLSNIGPQVSTSSIYYQLF